jgi:hypothetical protein
MLAGVAAALAGSSGFRARVSPDAIERWLARQARSAAAPSRLRSLRNPVPNNPEVLAEAGGH